MLNMSAEEILRLRTTRTGEQEDFDANVRDERPRERLYLEDQRWTIPEILAILRRQFRLISGVILIALVLAIIYLLLAPTRYTATTTLLTNTTRGQASPTGSLPDTLVDASVVESQIETLKSEKIGLAVIDKLQLWKDPEFVGSGPGLMTRILDAIGFSSPAAPTRDMKRRRAMAVFERDSEIQGVGHSYAAEIAFTSLDPRKAATIANAIADAYIEDQLGASFANAQRAGAWMQERLAEMRDKAHSAVQAVNDLKSKQNSAVHSADANAAATKLRALEAAAQNAKNLYDALLNRYTRVTQFMQQQSFPVTEARVLTRATPPPSKSSPKTATILLLAMMAGGTIGVGAALGRETIDTRVRRREQIERRVGLPSLGGLSCLRVSGAGGRKSPLWGRWWRGKYLGTKTNSLARRSDAPPLLTYDDPFAGNADTLRQIRLGIDRSVEPGGRLVGIISARGGEGRTTVAFNLATLTAQTGLRTLLLDGDLRNPFLMWSIAPDVEDGLVRVLRSEAKLGQVLLTHEFGFDLLGEPWGQLSAHPADILNSRRMAHLLTEMRRCYDYIFVDLPAVLEHVDAATSATLFDAFVLVAEWGQTTLEDIEQVMARSDRLAERTVGVVTNKVKSQGAHAF